MKTIGIIVLLMFSTSAFAEVVMLKFDNVFTMTGTPHELSDSDKEQVRKMKAQLITELKGMSKEECKSIDISDTGTDSKQNKIIVYAEAACELN